jgi:predicted Zn-dependent protease
MRRTHSKLQTLLTALLVLGLISCAVVEQGLDAIPGGEQIKAQKDTAVKAAKIVRQTFGDITEEEEYYIGRTVAALILSRYSVYQNNALSSYVNTLGNAVAVYSDRPETYAGYHFLILDTDEVNALSAPGGFIFISKGLLKRCQDEETLACILAHEVGHVSAKHGLQSIKKSRLVDAFRLLGQEAAQRYSPQQLAQLVNIFEGVLGDIVEKLIEKGYDRKYEYEADKLGAVTATRTGYNAQGLMDFLKTMADEEGKAGLKGWFQTHPSAKDRMSRVTKEISKLGTLPAKQTVRTNRFKSAMKSVR